MGRVVASESVLMSWPLEPVNATLFGKRALVDVIELKILGSGHLAYLDGP